MEMSQILMYVTIVVGALVLILFVLPGFLVSLNVYFKAIRGLCGRDVNFSTNTPTKEEPQKTVPNLKKMSNAELEAYLSNMDKSGF